MGQYNICGGRKLSGEISIKGAKNAILPILVSTVLNGGNSVIHNCPGITDSYLTCDILRSIGCKVTWEGDSIHIDSSCAHEYCVPEHLVTKMRSSIVFSGAILGRFKKVKISHPGGCEA